MNKYILSIIAAGLLGMGTWGTNVQAQSLPVDTSFSGLFNALKSEVDAPKMELILDALRNKPNTGNNDVIIEAGTQYTAIAYAESGNAAKANYLIGRMNDRSWKNSTVLAVVQKLIEAGKTTDAENIIKPIVIVPSPTASNFSEAEKHQLRFQYGVIRFKQSKYKEALPYLATSGGKQRSAETELYVLALIRSGNTELAFQEINKLLLKPVHFSPDFKAGVKTLFSKKYGSDQRFEMVMDSINAAQAMEMKAKMEKMKVDEAAPDFEIKDVNGKTVSLNSLRGKTIVIDFWATWCIPCVGSFPGMQKAVEHYKGDDSVVFMFVHTSEKVPTATEDAKKIIAAKKYTFDIYMDLKDKSTGRNPMASAFQVRGLPTKLVIDKKGIIRYRNTGYIGVDEAVPEISTMIEMSKL